VAGIALVTVGTLVGIGTNALAGTADPLPSAEPALGKLPAAPKHGLLGGKASTQRVVKDSYIVVFKDKKATKTTVHTQSTALAGTFGAKVHREFSRTLRGFSATMTAAQAKRLAADSRVAYVEPNHLLKLSDTQSNPPSWGLDRIDQTYLPLTKSYTPPTNGSGVTAYVIDSGIRITNTDFGGRASYGTNIVDPTANADDCVGHGTHVAGIIGSNTYGVAKGVNLVSVRVGDCTEDVSEANLAAGVEWVTAHAVQPAVANVSIGGAIDAGSVAVDDAIRASIAAGITYTIAAGNDETDACGTSPADVSQAITVGATSLADFRAGFSNYGSCVDMFAPGVGITSTYNTSDTATTVMGGTSMAAPHVAGAAALVLAAHHDWTPAQVADQIKGSAVKQAVHDASGSPNLLLNVNGTGSSNTLGLRASVNGQYVSADNAGKASLIASRWVMGGWEAFDIVPQAGTSYVALRAHANGKYVTAESGGAKPLIANRTAVGVWEEFTLDTAADGTFGLIARANGKYVSADNGGKGPLIAKGSSKGSWETFIPSGPNGVISLKAYANNKFITAESAGAKPLIANRAGAGPWEQFDIVDLRDGWVALRAHANARFVTADSGGAKPLIANRTAIGAWEAFFMPYGGDAVAMYANANGKWVTAESGGAKPLIANRTDVGPWENFYLR
jgi:subtilisin family serine protease